MVRQSVRHPARVQRLLQRIKHQRCIHAAHHPPADDITAVHVNDEGGVNVAAVRRHVGEVRHPQLVWPARAEVAFDQIRQVRTPFADGGALALAPPRRIVLFRPFAGEVFGEFRPARVAVQGVVDTEIFARVCRDGGQARRPPASLASRRRSR